MHAILQGLLAGERGGARPARPRSSVRRSARTRGSTDYNTSLELTLVEEAALLFPFESSELRVRVIRARTLPMHRPSPPFSCVAGAPPPPTAAPAPEEGLSFCDGAHQQETATHLSPRTRASRHPRTPAFSSPAMSRPRALHAALWRRERATLYIIRKCPPAHHPKTVSSSSTLRTWHTAAAAVRLLVTPQSLEPTLNCSAGC